MVNPQTQDYEIWPQETRNIAVSYDVEISTDYCFVLSQSTSLSDIRADGRTDVDSKTVRMRSQSHGKKTRGQGQGQRLQMLRENLRCIPNEMTNVKLGRSMTTERHKEIRQRNVKVRRSI